MPRFFRFDPRPVRIAALLLSIMLPTAGLAQSPRGEVVVASRGMSKGLSQTQGPQILVRGEAALTIFSLGAQYKNVSSAGADGEITAFAAVKVHHAGFELGLNLGYKRLTGGRGPFDRDCIEITPSVARKLGPVTARMSLVYSPDDLGKTGRSAFFEGGLAYSLDKKTSVSANFGRRERERAPDYDAFNLGVTRTLFGDVSADLRLYDTNRSGLDDPFKARLVGSVRARF